METNCPPDPGAEALGLTTEDLAAMEADAAADAAGAARPGGPGGPGGPSTVDLAMAALAAGAGAKPRPAYTVVDRRPIRRATVGQEREMRRTNDLMEQALAEGYAASTRAFADAPRVRGSRRSGHVTEDLPPPVRPQTATEVLLLRSMHSITAVEMRRYLGLPIRWRWYHRLMWWMPRV